MDPQDGSGGHQDRLDAAQAALDDGVHPEDPRVEEAAGLDTAEEELFETYDAGREGEEDTQMSVYEAVSKMPYDFSPARMRYVERTARLVADAYSEGQ
ncbi:hypothetical protein [Streptomyces sp. NPDC017941]|uniref:hypothetical protein n=1 Tax=Streptomyces sp. NPDC017941 TaxID=3365018 RepID=UPI003797D5C7